MVDYNELFFNCCQCIISWIFKVTAAIYFKEIKTGGAHNIPESGPVIFAIGPHSNQFIDPILMSQSCQRQVSFLCAEKSMHEPGVGFLLRMFRPIRVNRPQDHAVNGEGWIKSIDSCHITGINTKFTKQLDRNDYISFPKGYGEFKVVNIISDTECIVDLDTESSDPEKLSALLKDSNNRIEYRCMPHIEQAAVYKKVHAELNRNSTIGIFPEGGSHDRTQLLPLKGGVTAMAIGAMAKYNGLDVKIVPCGISYSQAHRFRSRVGIEFGEPITISKDMVEDFKAGGKAKIRSCSTLLNSIQEGLKAITINVDTYETLKFIKATRRIYCLPEKIDIFEQNQIDRRLSIGYNQFQNHSKMTDLHRRITAHQHILEYYNINDYQIPQTIYGGSKTCLKLVVNLFFFLLFLLLSAPGIILNIPVATAVDYIGSAKSKAALKNSTVKIYGRDVISTWKIISSYALLPVQYAFYTFAVLMYLKDKDIEFRYKIAVPITIWCSLPYVSFLSVLSYEKSQDFKKFVTSTFLAIFDQKTARILRENHQKLSNEINEIVDEFKPKVFPDLYNNEKLDTSKTKPATVLDIPTLSHTVLGSRPPNSSNGFLHQCFGMDWFEEGEDPQEKHIPSLFNSDKEAKEYFDEKQLVQDNNESVLLHLSKSPSPSILRGKENRKARKTSQNYKISRFPELFKRKTRRILRFDDGLLTSYKRTDSI